VDESVEATAAARSYRRWLRPVGWSALVAALISLPLCVWLALAVASTYVDSLRTHDVVLRLAEADSGPAHAALWAGVVLAVAALLAALAAILFHPGEVRAPLAARWGLVVSLLSLASMALAVVGGWAFFMFSWSGPA
jgi:hypothetical protein